MFITKEFDSRKRMHIVHKVRQAQESNAWEGRLENWQNSSDHLDSSPDTGSEVTDGYDEIAC